MREPETSAFQMHLALGLAGAIFERQDLRKRDGYRGDWSDDDPVRVAVELIIAIATPGIEE